MELCLVLTLLVILPGTLAKPVSSIMEDLHIQSLESSAGMVALALAAQEAIMDSLEVAQPHYGDGAEFSAEETGRLVRRSRNKRAVSSGNRLDNLFKQTFKTPGKI